MGKKIFFQDGSAIEISTEILKPGEMATVAYRRLIEYIEEELEIEDFNVEEEEDELTDEDFEDLDDDDLEELDDDDLEELDFDDAEEWEDEEDVDDKW